MTLETQHVELTAKKFFGGALRRESNSLSLNCSRKSRLYLNLVYLRHWPSLLHAYYHKRGVAAARRQRGGDDCEQPAADGGDQVSCVVVMPRVPLRVVMMCCAACGARWLLGATLGMQHLRGPNGGSRARSPVTPATTWVTVLREVYVFFSVAALRSAPVYQGRCQ